MDIQRMFQDFSVWIQMAFGAGWQAHSARDRANTTGALRTEVGMKVVRGIAPRLLLRHRHGMR